MKRLKKILSIFENIIVLIFNVIWLSVEDFFKFFLLYSFGENVDEGKVQLI